LKDTTRLPNPILILVGASVMMSLAIGMRQSLGLFLPPVTHDLGLTTADYTFGIAAQNVAWGVAQAPVGAIADKLGLQPVLLFGAVLYVAAMIVMGLANGVPALTLSGILIGVSIACTGSSLAMTATARAVSPARRSLLLGIIGAFLGGNSVDRASAAVPARALGHCSGARYGARRTPHGCGGPCVAAGERARKYG
jgi:MFS family permease